MGDHDWMLEKTTDELLEAYVAPTASPGSIVDNAMRAVLDVRIAEMQRDAARDSLLWAKLAAVSTSLAALIALIALLVATF
jgi:hypothetical protein